MGTTKNRSYGKTVKTKAVRLKAAKKKYDKAVAEATRLHKIECRGMNLPREEMKKFPNIFEVD